MSAEPLALAAALERRPPVPPGAGERYLGYSIMGLPFSGGDVLALRRFPATSLGPAYTSVWHRDRDGRWVFYSDVAPAHGCTAYWNGAIDHAVVAPIRVEWTTPHQITVFVDNGRLIAWSMTLSHTPATRLLSAVASLLPRAWWQWRVFTWFIGTAAGAALRAGRLTLTARTSSGHRFTAVPHAVRLVASSRATVLGRDLGAPGALRPRAALGEFLVPQRGIFATGLITVSEEGR